MKLFQCPREEVFSLNHLVWTDRLIMLAEVRYKKKGSSITWLFPVFRLPNDPWKFGNWIFDAFGYTWNWIRVAMLLNLNKNPIEIRTSPQQNLSWKPNLNFQMKHAIVYRSAFCIRFPLAPSYRMSNARWTLSLCCMRTFVWFSSVNCVNNKTRTKTCLCERNIYIGLALNACGTRCIDPTSHSNQKPEKSRKKRSVNNELLTENIWCIEKFSDWLSQTPPQYVLSLSVCGKSLKIA